ncbi:unnamed protein product [Brassica rapa]|uniref:F-box domain-containing protein n=1 Tax=Brassica campestris TaxID=3711 RepID=A0A8D9GRJ5_BRACM|nr:unnamed protein product [Brassica rapa]
MALGKKRIIVVQKSHLKQRRGVEDGGLGLELELELVQYKRGFGRKRVLISSGDEICDSPVGKTSSKKLCDEASAAGGQSRELEDLPLDILVNLSFYDLWIILSYLILLRIICGVEHEDLKQLFHVSKAVREATLIAKQSHFAYSTPRKTSVFERSRFGLDKPSGLGDGDDYEIEAPAAPLQKRYRSRDEDNSGVSVALFK